MWWLSRQPQAIADNSPKIQSKFEHRRSETFKLGRDIADPAKFESPGNFFDADPQIFARP
jgi:hypothetical protein